MVYRRRARRGCEAIVVHRRRARRGCEAIVGTGMAPTQPTLMEPRGLRRDGGHEQGTTKATSPPHDGHDVRPAQFTATGMAPMTTALMEPRCFANTEVTKGVNDEGHSNAPRWLRQHKVHQRWNHEERLHRHHDVHDVKQVWLKLKSTVTRMTSDQI